MSKTTKTVLSIIVIALIFWIVADTKSQRTLDSVNPIKIGAALSLSGDAAQDGESIKDGLELAKVDLKKQDIDIEIIYQDDNTQPKDTVSAINALAVQGVQAIIGPTWSYLADAGVPVADRLGLVTLMPANTSEYVSSKSPYAFFTTNKVADMIPMLTDWLKSSGKKKIAVIRNQGAWYETVGKAVEQSAASAGVEIVFSEEVSFGADSATLSTIIAKAKSTKADLLFFEIDDLQGVTTVLNKVQEQKLPLDVMSVTTSVGRVISTGGVKWNGINKLYVVSPKPSVEFQNKYEATYGKVPQAYADRAYDSLMILADAFKNKGDVALAEYLRNTTDYKGYAGQYKFDLNGDISGGVWEVKEIK